ncbi:MAG: molybdopterin-dependent oxidoreductase, partial [Acidimicrobiia bacterium]|nr:molybdopterin-dependent oxidoreductase [Acidimicrobiia bacterium]
MTTQSVIPSFIGAPVQRREDPALVRGTARYVDDIAPAGTLHLALVRSPFPHALITAIDFDAAREVEGVWAIITPDDVADVTMPPEPNPDKNIPRRFPLVQGKALMPGDPVAAVVAETPAAARDAADLIFVDYEPLDVVGDVEQAMTAPPIHEGQASNVAYDRGRGERSDFEALEGEIRLSGVVEHPRVVPAPMEPRAILAEWKEDGLTVHLSSQAPQLMQEELAGSFGLPQAAVRVITPFVGGGFGCKFDLAEEEYLTVIAARMTGRPVKWIEGRREHLLTIGHGRAQRHKWEVVARSDGKIEGLWVDSLVDLG